MNDERNAAWILVATTALAGLGWIFSKETIQGLPPFGFIGLRFIVASACLFPLCHKQIRTLDKKQLAKLVLAGLVMGSALLVWVHAVSVSETLGEGAFIVSLSMIIVPIIAWALYRERPKRAFWVATPIAIVGLAFLSLQGSWNNSPGQVWFLASACLLALHFNINSKLAKSLPVMAVTCVQLCIAGGLACSASLLFEDFPDSIEPSIWGWFAASAVLATSLRYVMQTLGQKGSSPANAALIMLLEPIWTVIFSVLWYGEQLSVNKYIGCSFILISLLYYRTDGRFIRIRK